MMSNHRKLILVDDSMAILNSYYVLLKKHGFLVFIASSGEEALLKAQAIRPEIMVIDMQMPEMDGFQLIRRVRDNAELRDTPMILFSATITEEDVARAKHLGVIDCVCKGRVSTEGLVDRIEKCIARRPAEAAARAVTAAAAGAKDAPEAGDRGRIRARILRALLDASSIKRGADLIQRLNDLIENPNVKFGEVTRVIESEPEVAARVLRVANSAYYLRREKTESVPQAIKKLGIAEVCRLARTIVTLQMAHFKDHRGLQETFGRHSFAVSSLAQRLATAHKDLAATVGLLHDVGVAFLLREFAAEYRPIWERAAASHVPLVALEREHLGIDHVEVGERLLAQCNLPAMVAAVVSLHETHPSEIRGQDAATRAIHEILWVADHVSGCLGQGLALPHDEEGGRWEAIPSGYRTRKSWLEYLEAIESGVVAMSGLSLGPDLRQAEGKTKDDSPLHEVMIVTPNLDNLTWPEVALYPRVKTRVRSFESFSFGEFTEGPVILAPLPEDFADCRARAADLDGEYWIYDSRRGDGDRNGEDGAGGLPADRIIRTDLTKNELLHAIANPGAFQS